MSVLDHPSLGADYSYSVASVDAVGNEALAGPVVQNLLLGAVTELQAFLNHGEAPTISWESNDPSAVGFNIYRGETRLNTSLVTDHLFIDNTYAGTSMTEYRVRAVNSDSEEGPARTIRVFPLNILAKSNPSDNGYAQPLITMYFNTYGVGIVNRDTSHILPLSEIDCWVTVDGEEEFTGTKVLNTQVAPGETYSDSFVAPVGGSTHDRVLVLTATQVEDGMGTVIYQRSIVFDNAEPSKPMVELVAGDLALAGGMSTVNMCINNHGYVAMDIIVGRNNGQSPGDIYLSILNEEGLEISRAYYEGTPPGTMDWNGTWFVTLEPGGSLCVDIDILVPAGLEPGDRIEFVGSLASMTYELEGAAQADQETYTGDDTVLITGRALNQSTGLPEPEAALKLGFYVRGFK
ncbi:MAG: hypothetical protein P8X92_08345, partial [Dehalococcoidia bacterium]